VRRRSAAGPVAPRGRHRLRDAARQPGRERGVAASGNRARPGGSLGKASMTAGVQLGSYIDELGRIEPCRWTGQVTDVVGLLVESRGPGVAIGDVCEVTTGQGQRIRTQVVGFRQGRVLSMPLEEIEGLQQGNLVKASTEDAGLE